MAALFISINFIAAQSPTESKVIIAEMKGILSPQVGRFSTIDLDRTKVKQILSQIHGGLRVSDIDSHRSPMLTNEGEEPVFDHLDDH
jgi:hypothetical protein